MRKYLYVLIIFILLNVFKVWMADNLVITDGTGFILLTGRAVVRFLFYLLIDVIIFITFIRLKSRIFLLLFYFLQGIYVFTHIAYFLYFNDLFHIQQFFFQFHEGVELVKYSAIPTDQRYFIILLDMPLFISIMIYLSKTYEFVRINLKNLNLKRIFFFICIIIALPFCFKSDFAEAHYMSGRSENFILERYGLFANDLSSILFFKWNDFFIKGLFSEKEIVFKNDRKEEPKNIICIQVESLDANVINYKYKGRYIAPFLSELTKSSIYYPYMLTYPSLGATSDTGFTVINSLIPPRILPSFSFPKYNYPNSLLKRLSDAGFEITAFHNNRGGYFKRDRTFPKMGFNEFWDIKKMGLKEYGWGARDGDVFNFVKNRLIQQKKPFLYYVITMSSHEPFKSVRSYYSNKYYDDIKEEIARDYFNAISYVDKTLEDFVLFITNNIPDTYIFIFGDHFFHCNECTLFKRGGFKYKDEYLMAVPLFIITPDSKRYIERHKVASVLDIAPTILYASKVDFNIRTEGVNLADFPIAENLVVLPFYSVANRVTVFMGFECGRKKFSCQEDY